MIQTQCVPISSADGYVMCESLVPAVLLATYQGETHHTHNTVALTFVKETASCNPFNAANPFKEVHVLIALSISCPFAALALTN